MQVQLAAEQAFSEMAHVVRTVGGAIESDMLGIVLKLAASKEEAQRVCAANVSTPPFFRKICDCMKTGDCMKICDCTAWPVGDGWRGSEVDASSPK